MHKQNDFSYFICNGQQIPGVASSSNCLKLILGENFSSWIMRAVPLLISTFPSMIQYCHIYKCSSEQFYTFYISFHIKQHWETCSLLYTQLFCVVILVQQAFHILLGSTSIVDFIPIHWVYSGCREIIKYTDKFD